MALPQPFSHSAALPEWLEELLSHSARVAGAATRPLSHSARVAGAATQPPSHSARVALQPLSHSGWGGNFHHCAFNLCPATRAPAGFQCRALWTHLSGGKLAMYNPNFQYDSTQRCDHNFT